MLNKLIFVAWERLLGDARWEAEWKKTRETPVIRKHNAYQKICRWANWTILTNMITMLIRDDRKWKRCYRYNSSRFGFSVKFCVDRYLPGWCWTYFRRTFDPTGSVATIDFEKRRWMNKRYFAFKRIVFICNAFFRLKHYLFNVFFLPKTNIFETRCNDYLHLPIRVTACFLRVKICSN